VLPISTYVWKTARRALSLEPDIIHCNTYFPVYAGEIASRLLRVPLITTFHDIYSLGEWVRGQDSLFWGLLGHFATIFAARLPQDRIVAVSQQCKSKLTALGVPERKITIIPNGVDLSLFDATIVEKKPRQVLYVGRLVRLKNVDLLIRAFATVVGNIPNATLKVVGDGPERPALESLAAHLGLSQKITFTGRTPSYSGVAHYFKESAVFVLPSTVEGESIAAKEAMAAGLPVIATRIRGSGILSAVRDGQNGFLVEPYDPTRLAQKIVQLLQNERLMQTMGAAGRGYVQNVDWSVIADRTFRVYEDALRASGALYHGRG
jgi:glycosyltransferase involved in cell wall biosynthesis